MCSVFFSFLLMFQLACSQMSERQRDENAGMNGGFEVVQDGLPVNWMLYTPETVKNAKFQILLDQEVFKEGKQSLLFDIQECSDIGGWKSPGLANQFDLIQGETYTLTFWIKSEGCKFKLEARGVSPKKGEEKKPILIEQDHLEWTRYEYPVMVPKEFDQFRFELSILSPGKLWIDNFSLIKL